MKFNLHQLGHADDPLGYTQTTVVEVKDSTSPAAPAGSFKLAAQDDWIPATPQLPEKSSNLYDAFGSERSEPVRSSMRDVKIKLVSAPPDGFFDGATSGDAIKLARPGTGDEIFEAFTPNDPDAPFSKGAAADFQKFSQFTKVQETDDGNIEVWGVATHEQPDLDGESCDYETAKRAYQDWSTAAVSRTSAAGQQISLGPIRYQHSTEPAGKATKIQYDDDGKAIWLGSVPINDDIRKQLQDGYLTGYSQGGSYAWRRCADCGKNLTLQQANNYRPDCKKKVPVTFGLGRLSEVSYVDSPCTGKGFSYVKQDGSSQFVSFAKKAGGRVFDERVTGAVAMWFAGHPL